MGHFVPYPEKEVTIIPYVNVPNDLSKIKTKVAFNLTKRQLICFGCGAAVGIPAYLLARGAIGNTGGLFLMLGVMLPAFLLAMYEKHGQPLEVIAGNMITVLFLTPKERPYRTENYYAVLEKQQKLKKEVNAIVKQSYERQTAKRKGKAVTGRKKADSRPYPAGKGGR